MDKLTIAKVLRSSFNQKQAELLKVSYMDDAFCLKIMRDMQAEYKEFRVLVADLKANDKESYDKL